MSNRYESQKIFWEKAGQTGYGNAMFSSRAVERHIMAKHWQAALETAGHLGLNKDSRIIELGCGDGTFSGNILSERFKSVDAYDNSTSAIERAKAQLKSDNVSYYVEDLTTFNSGDDAHWDGAFMIGFLHHVKDFTPGIIVHLSKVCPKVVVVEPNGDNIIRKSLELTPSYKSAGEDSFRLKYLLNIFNSSGYETIAIRRITLVPSFLPEFLLLPFKKLEDFVESSSFLSRLCSTYVLGFEQPSKIATRKI